MSFNQVILIGRLSSDIDIKKNNNGSSVARFDLATNESFKDKSGETQKRTEFHKVIVFGKLAEICAQFVSKGRQVQVVGSIQTRSYEKDGSKRYITEIISKQVIFLDPSEKSHANNTTPVQNQSNNNTNNSNSYWGNR